MRIAREIGTYKKEHGITVLQAGRYNEILEKRGAQGEQCGMDAEFMKKYLKQSMKNLFVNKWKLLINNQVIN